MMRFSLSCFGLYFLFVAVHAAEAPLEHFARGFHLEVDGQSAIYQLPLPEEVYKTVVRSDLGDIRVFNSNGEAVPHAVRKPERTQTRETVRLVLPFFPFDSEVANLNENENVDIMVANDGAIIHIKSRGNDYVAENAVINSYLIDLSSLSQSLDELEFELSGGDNGYVKRVSLQASDDLNVWHSYVSNATLAELDYGGHSLKKNRIKLPNRKVKYLRFDWQGDSNGIQIKTIRATLNTVYSSHERNWSQVTGARSKDDSQIIEFDTGGLFPIDRIELVLPETNTLIEAVLSSRPDKAAQWTSRHSGLFYNLQVNNSRLEREPASVRLTTDRYWQLRISTRGGLGSELPVLKFAWVPNDLYFLARGTGPFTLAFGNGQIGAPGRPIDALMNVLGDNQTGLLVGAAQITQAVDLLGEDALAPELEIPWQRILLWAVLIAGVIVVGFMAFRLMKQLNTA